MILIVILDNLYVQVFDIFIIQMDQVQNNNKNNNNNKIMIKIIIIINNNNNITINKTLKIIINNYKQIH